ncbi:MAG: hypothetical protein LPJ89_09580 [Hymenobacteraceae bacterium]|nr:hypothetical protein [Hymenobacteraceae bacterium]MDX5397270.1 hypothetical protein [Hymenobacteraceae bacterium]MDX5444016.1 hypothetical protein [Hymenobacteraceae bacterium]MDX5513348.1 hypothetical protein [Hymenobacteraceae bacterium]
MPGYKSKNTESSENKGRPAGEGQPKGGVKTTGGPENIQRNAELREKHTQSADEPQQDAKRGSDPNRNTDKPEIDNNKYN